jgi:hypothetical protein
VLVAGKSLGRWLAVTWNAQRAQPPYVAEFADLLAGALRKNHPGHEYDFAPAIEPPRLAHPSTKPAISR